jgi:hypothetical protein
MSFINDAIGLAIMLFAFRLIIAIATQEGKVSQWDNFDKMFASLYLMVLFVASFHFLTM